MASRGMVRRMMIAVMATSTITGATEAGHAARPVTSADTQGAGRYIVTFAGQPAASYRGGIPGLAATAPRAGTRLAARSIAVTQYVNHLKEIKRSTLGRLGISGFTDYSLVLNGAAVNLTATQAQQLARDPHVLSLAKDRLEKVQTNHSPQFLGVPDLWNTMGGQDRAGSGVVVGILDTGIWPQSASFRATHTPVPSSFVGTCQKGERFAVSDCNDKIVGARYYLSGYGRENISDKDFISPRDGEGHGTHTASTAAGDRVDDVKVDGRSLGSLSGMAPGARIASYKVCWTGKPGVAEDGCRSSDVIAAIDDAVEDGVDVINFSVGNAAETPVGDPQEMAFLNAAAAGVFVSASAGNSGPGTSTLDHPSPWVTTVAASTHKVFEQVLELGDGRRFVGASATDPLPEQTPMVLASKVPAKGRTAGASKLCLPDSLDPAKVKGRIVVCLRGDNPRVEKSYVVKKAGGVGVVLINPSTNSLNTDLHHLPSIHLQNTHLKAITAYVTAGGATGRIVALNPGESTTQAPEVAPFSARGPSTTTEGNILKPDVSAPGVDVIGAVTPFNNHGRTYDAMSGTSMAAPHVAGLAALLKQAHPGWTPMMIKSALMTTARDMVTRTSPFAQGAGNVQPMRATDPGVVVNSGVRDWVGYLKGLGALRPGAYPTIPVVRAIDLNQPSIAVGAMPGSVTVRRTVTSVSDQTETYTLSNDVPGLAITSAPGSLTLAPGETRSVSITLRREGASLTRWTTGHLTLTSGRHTARLPVAVRPVLAAAPAQVSVPAAAAGTRVVRVRAGSEGTLTTSIQGLVGTTPARGTLHAGEFDPEVPETGQATDARTIKVPAGTAMLRIDTSMPKASDDLDLYLYKVVGGRQELVRTAATASGAEVIEIPSPGAGTYRAYVNGYSVKGTGAYTFRSWTVPTRASGNLAAAPASSSVKQAETTSVTLSWRGLDRRRAWFGLARFRIDAKEAATTGVLINQAR